MRESDAGRLEHGWGQGGTGEEAGQAHGLRVGGALRYGMGGNGSHCRLRSREEVMFAVSSVQLSEGLTAVPVLSSDSGGSDET